MRHAVLAVAAFGRPEAERERADQVADLGLEPEPGGGLVGADVDVLGEVEHGLDGHAGVGVAAPVADLRRGDGAAGLREPREAPGAEDGVVGEVDVEDHLALGSRRTVDVGLSQVEGELREGLSYMDVLKATFPAGTVSGAPKIRAIEIIQELEPHKRNIYAGAIGYIGWNGDADTAIAIRTAVIQDGRLFVQAGGGIVFDSDPAKEWEETMNKGRALFRAVAQAAGGL